MNPRLAEESELKKICRKGENSTLSKPTAEKIRDEGGSWGLSEDANSCPN